MPHRRRKGTTHRALTSAETVEIGPQFNFRPLAKHFDLLAQLLGRDDMSL